MHKWVLKSSLSCVRPTMETGLGVKLLENFCWISAGWWCMSTSLMWVQDQSFDNCVGVCSVVCYSADSFFFSSTAACWVFQRAGFVPPSQSGSGLGTPELYTVLKHFQKGWSFFTPSHYSQCQVGQNKKRSQFVDMYTSAPPIKYVYLHYLKKINSECTSTENTEYWLIFSTKHTLFPKVIFILYIQIIVLCTHGLYKYSH